ncbi:MAG: Hpt domain-containing protein, partial [Leptolyngbyaceae cyanobacterium MO_188.B28]|nr:Hpt domain-containing protein [Leptolyngbyaceae cyanobacterium MO_188.B28]
MFIEDAELRSLYRDASKDHLAKLEAGLLYLEKHPDDSAKLKELLRATHSLKGDSRMLGVQDAETLTHQMEDLLSTVEQGQRAFTPTLCDCLYQGLDAVRKIAHEAVTGDPSDVSVFHVLAQLMSADDSAAVEDTLEPDAGLSEPPAFLSDMALNDEPIDSSFIPESLLLTSEHETTENGHAQTNGNGKQNGNELDFPPLPIEAELKPTDPVAPLKIETASSEQSASGSEAYHIDTVRVEAPKLDALMTQAGELAVTKRLITRRTDAIGKLLSFWEEWTRDALVNRLTIDNLGRELEPEALTPLQTVQQLNEGRLESLGELLKQLHGNAYEDSARLESLSNDLESGILKLRQLPLSSMFSLFPRMVRDLAKEQGKNINLVIEGGDTQADKRILEEMKAPLTHIIRNAIDHGIE